MLREHVRNIKTDEDLLNKLFDRKNHKVNDKVLYQYMDEKQIDKHYEDALKRLLMNIYNSNRGGKKRKTTRNKKNKRKSIKLRRKSKRSN